MAKYTSLNRNHHLSPSSVLWEMLIIQALLVKLLVGYIEGKLIFALPNSKVKVVLKILKSTSNSKNLIGEKKKKKDTNKSRRTQTKASSSHGKLALIFSHSVLLTTILHSFIHYKQTSFNQSHVNNFDFEIQITEIEIERTNLAT